MIARWQEHLRAHILIYKEEAKKRTPVMARVFENLKACSY